MKKLFRIMKLTSLFLLISVVSVFASKTYAQTNTLNLNIKKATVKEVLSEIEDQSEFYFMYSGKYIDVNREVSIHVDNQKIEHVLELIFAGTDVSYKKMDRIIILSGQETLNDRLSSVSQQQTITGTVTDNSGKPLPGVTVVVKGTTRGTITNTDGQYALTDVPGNATLVFSFVGMKMQELAVAGKQQINVVLEEETIGIEEVVAIGYGVQKKSDITGSLSSIGSEDFKNQPIVDFTQALMAKVPGVSITNTSGAPGGNVKVRIRGANSMLGSNAPLYIVDGIAYNLGINTINTNDVESIEVLKDASATAIYGSRGANGVILITTKNGSSSTPRIEMNANLGISEVANPYDLLNAADYARLINTTYDTEVFSPGLINQYEKVGGTDWQDMIFKTGYVQNYQASVSGGGEKTKYFISGNYIDEKGIVVNTSRQKYSFRANLNTVFNSRLEMRFSLFASKRDARNTGDESGGSKGSPIWNSVIWSPTESVYEADGSYNTNDQYGSLQRNPYMIVKERQRDKFETSTILSSSIKYKIVDDLHFDIIFGADKLQSETAIFTNEYVDSNTGSSWYNADSFNWQLSSMLTYSKAIGNHAISIVAGAEESVNEWRSFGAYGTILASTSVGYYNLGLNESKSIASSYSRSALRSYFGRVNYSYKSKYLFTGTWRADGSSKFADGNKFGYFPSLALGWRASEEEFVQSLNIFDNLKFRASWGVTGNQAINAYATMALLSGANFSYGTTTLYPGYYPRDAANSNLKWEETEQANLGADMAFLNKRISITADYFVKKTTGLLQRVNLPDYNGGGTVVKNIGEIENKGVELGLTFNPIRTDKINWDLSFNFTSIKNEVKSVGDEERIFPGTFYADQFYTDKIFVVHPGEALGSFWGYKFLGIWKSGESEEAAKYGNKPGDNRYEDLNSDDVIDGKDMQIIGNSLPDFTWGINSTLHYKNFELNILIDGLQGSDVLNGTYSAAAASVGDARSITLAEAGNYWTTDDENTIWPNVKSSSNSERMSSSKWLQDGSFVKLRNISLSYLIPKERIGIGDLKVSLSGQNLLTITDYKGFDPEASVTGSSDVDTGLDLGAYPAARTITFGLNLSF